MGAGLSTTRLTLVNGLASRDLWRLVTWWLLSVMVTMKKLCLSVGSSRLMLIVLKGFGKLLKSVVVFGDTSKGKDLYLL